ncbi:5-oxoprolinase subunit PxpB [Nitrincola schmidtii]|uniref:5-oxoprolinase subunit PxpB n=1 Tax=Nitrincola schmidtii TaxID=1730894 RepID=UPI00124E8BB0|nr:5-oxoprolinase subunit PxpB [Nitrincola schmidtii]
MKVSSVSENACLIQVGDQISESLTAVIAKLSSAIEEILGDALIDLIPSYTTLLCIYDLNKVDDLWMLKTLRQITQEVGTNQNHEVNTLESLGRLIELPVWYDPEVGYDLEEMASDKQMSHAELIQLHTAKEYRVFASGFMPGFAYMGSVNAALATPRQKTPRKAVAAGSVGIADTQTSVYPAQSPGGWNIIGRSPTRLFDISRGDKAALLQVGDRVRFLSIDKATFLELGGQLG